MSDQIPKQPIIQINPLSETSATTNMTVLVGTNGTGKTTFLRQQANIALRNGKRVLVITPDDREWNDIPLTMLRKGCTPDFLYTGIRRHIFGTTTLEMLDYFRNGIIIFDDCRYYIQANSGEKVRHILIRRRQMGVDIFAVGHGFNEVPPVFFTFATHFVVYKTRDNISRRKNYIRDYERVSAKVDEVNMIADGLRSHPKDYNGKDAHGKPMAGRRVPDIHYCDVIKNE